MFKDRDRPILVTGATGMIGANLIRRLMAVNASNIVATRRTSSSLHRLDGLLRQVDLIDLDMTSGRQVREAIRTFQPQVVFHLASTIWSRVAPDDSVQHTMTNSAGIHHLLEAIRCDSPDTRLVFSGSSAAYGSGERMREDRLPAPTTVYGCSKAAASELLMTYCRVYGLSGIELRLFTPYGPWEQEDRLIPYVTRMLVDGNDVELTSGVQQRDFVFVDDVVQALALAAVRSDVSGEVINIASGQGTTVRDAARVIKQVVGHPSAELRFGTKAQREDEMLLMSADVSKAQRLLDWTPSTSLTSGVRTYMEWLMRRRAVVTEAP